MPKLISKDSYSLKGLVDSEVSLFLNSAKLNSSKKKDGTWVTSLDLNLSNLFKDFFSKKHPEFNFYSEEDFDRLIFPSVIVDPIDGTRGLIDKSYESSISIALMYSNDLSDIRNDFFIYAPFELKLPGIDDDSILVSKMEKMSGMHIGDDYIAIGSIALKLLILSKEMGGAVISRRPKNIWDIAAGTQLLHRLGYSFFSEGEEILKLDKKLYRPPLIWGKRSFLKKKKLI